MDQSPSHCVRGNARAVIAIVLSVAALALLWYLFDVILLVFAAILLAVLIRAPSNWLAARSRLSERWALALVLFTVLLVLAAAVWLLGASVKQQLQGLSEQIPVLLEQARSYLEQRGWWQGGLRPRALLQDSSGAFLGRGLDIITTTFGALANVALVLFMAVLFAAQPRLYVRGSVKLVPKARRRRTEEIFERLGETMRRWLVGQLVLMTFVAVSTSLGLWMLNVPYSLALGLVAGLLTFIPFIGPLFAAAVAILVGLTVDITTAYWVALLYIAIQIVEGVFEPIVQQRAVYLPPVLLVFGQLTLGVLVGILGVVLAAPLTAVAMVAIQMIYVEDVLGERDPSTDNEMSVSK